MTIDHAQDSLWNVDLFRRESIHLQTYWVLAVMDQFTRQIVGFGVWAGDVDGNALCRIFHHAISRREAPRYLSSDNDPLFRHLKWQSNLRILKIKEIKTDPFMPLSNPFLERLIGTIRRESLDHLFFWNMTGLQRKLNAFQQYYNTERVQCFIGWTTAGGKICKSRFVTRFSMAALLSRNSRTVYGSLNSDSPCTRDFIFYHYGIDYESCSL